MPGSSGSTSVPDKTTVQSATRILAAGGVVVYPTETLYGLGVDASHEAALQRLVELKVRPPTKPIALLISDVTMLRDLVEEVPPAAMMLMRHFWPGPLTLVLAARAAVSPLLTAGSASIGVRASSHPVAMSLVRTLGRPVTAPSANPAGRPAPTDIAQARAYFGARVDHYLDAGSLPGEPASTVVDVRDGLRLVREGAVALAALRACLQNAA